MKRLLFIMSLTFTVIISTFFLLTAQTQNEKDITLIKEYCAKNKIKPKQTTSGLFYIIDKKGKGKKPTNGQNVTVHYKGTLLDGTKFDASYDRNQPFSFLLGKGRVIKGWDEGIPLFSKGGKGRLFIPSSMAYGERSPSPNIFPNSVLIFEIELLDFK